jgi:hypothetical protein
MVMPPWARRIATRSAPADAQTRTPTHYLEREAPAPVPGRWEPAKDRRAAEEAEAAGLLAQRELEDRLLLVYDALRAERTRVAVLESQLITAGIEPKARE